MADQHVASKYGYALGAIGSQINSAHFEHIKSKLKFRKTPQEKAVRDAIWKQFDINSNGLLSLAEIDKGLRDVLQLGENLFRAKKAIASAFHAAKNGVKLKGKHADDYVNRCEFRLLMKYLWEYFLLYNAFMTMEEDGDLRLSKEEFLEHHDKIEEIVGDIKDPQGEWKKMKVGQNGHVLFSDFAEWAYAKLPYSDDED